MYVYIITNKSNKVLYIGVTNEIQRRLAEHRLGINDGFSKKYSLDKLVYCELFDDPDKAIAREKQLKGWTRRKKDQLIETVNPDWIDLSTQYKFTNKDLK